MLYWHKLLLLFFQLFGHPGTLKKISFTNFLFVSGLKCTDLMQYFTYLLQIHTSLVNGRPGVEGPSQELLVSL
jgi:hypothetical protein